MSRQMVALNQVYVLQHSTARELNSISMHCCFWPQSSAVLTYLTEGVRACWNDERLGGITGHSFPDR